MSDLPVIRTDGALDFKPAHQEPVKREINCKPEVAIVAREFSYECDCVHHIAELYCHRCGRHTRFIVERYLDRPIECVFCSGKMK